MDALAIVTIAGTGIGLIAGCVQVADYLEKKRAARTAVSSAHGGTSHAPARPAEHRDVSVPHKSPAPDTVLPDGTVAFLFADVEDSAALWQSRPDVLRQSLPRFQSLFRERVQAYEGHVFDTKGEACRAVFASPQAAVRAALDIRLALHRQTEQLPVRMALHVGEAAPQDGDYFGASPGRTARLRDAAHGGQTLLSDAAQALVKGGLPNGASLADRGRHLLPDLQKPERIYELRHESLPDEFPPPHSLSILPNNLPQQLTSFVGRDAQIAEVKRLLSSERLLTLTGSGGSGKTRLALQVAAESAPAYPDGVWLIDLAPIMDAGLVPRAVCGVLGVREESGRSLPDVLAAHVRDCRMLLILDSCEHLLSACAPLCERLLQSCPYVSVLVTSRENLGIAGEQSYRVPSLALPDLGPLPAPDLLGQYESVRLFVDRARLQGGDFVLSAGNAGSVAQVCRGLDGIPFAIELAAARVRVLPVEQIATRLDDCFRLLTGGSRTALPRHQTLRALIDWSYDLLAEPEKALICRLSVFSGGWDLEAAEAVCGAEDASSAGRWDVMELLGALVEKSLVVYEPDWNGQAGRARYRLLETVRRYAGERLEERGERERVHARHRDCFLTLAERAAPLLVGAEQGAWLARLECEHDNLRAALQWSRSEPDGAEDELRLAGALWRFWAMRGYFSEGRERLARALARGAGQPDGVRAAANFGAGVLAWQQCEYGDARALLEESLALNRAAGDMAGVAGALNSLGQIAYEEGDYPSAHALLEESLGLYRQTGERRGEAVALMNLANLASEQGRYAEARALYDGSLALHRKEGDRAQIANGLLNSGSAALEEGSFAAAETMLREAADLSAALGDKRGMAYAGLCRADALLRQGRAQGVETVLQASLALCRELGDRRGVAIALELSGRLAAAQGENILAVRLFGAADALRDEIHAPLSGKDTQVKDALDALRAALGDAQFDGAWDAGRALSLADACAHALSPINP